MSCEGRSCTYIGQVKQWRKTHMMSAVTYMQYIVEQDHKMEEVTRSNITTWTPTRASLLLLEKTIV